jgi:hypothetical protein
MKFRAARRAFGGVRIAHHVLVVSVSRALQSGDWRAAKSASEKCESSIFGPHWVCRVAYRVHHLFQCIRCHKSLSTASLRNS